MTGDIDIFPELKIKTLPTLLAAFAPAGASARRVPTKIGPLMW